LLADHSKITLKSSVLIGHLAYLQAIVTDEGISERQYRSLKQAGTTVQLAALHGRPETVASGNGRKNSQINNIL